MDVRALSHITGGGLLENIPRVLPEQCKAVINSGSWQIPPVFQWLQEQGGVADREMIRTFNCGVGMVVVVPAEEVDEALALLRHNGESAWLLGQIEARSGEEEAVQL